jgi:hypothetical protein
MPVNGLTSKEKRFIIKNRFKMCGSDMSRQLGRPRNAAAQWMRNNGYTVSKKLQIKFRSQGMIGKSIVSEYADFFIFCNYLDIPVKAMADLLSYNDNVIQLRVKRLGLVIPREIIEQRKKDSRLKPGNIPANKGKKQSEYMSREAIARTKATRFKKGEIPPNKRHFKDGDITTRHRVDRPNEKPHKYIRIRLRVWKELQIYNWEKKNGPVPKGFVLACKDGNTLNCRPSNWYLMSKYDNMKRNSGAINLPDKMVAAYLAGKNNMQLKDEFIKHPELIKAKRTEILLNRKINYREKQIGGSK